MDEVEVNERNAVANSDGLKTSNVSANSVGGKAPELESSVRLYYDKERQYRELLAHQNAIADSAQDQNASPELSLFYCKLHEEIETLWKDLQQLQHECSVKGYDVNDTQCRREALAMQNSQLAEARAKQWAIETVSAPWTNDETTSTLESGRQSKVHYGSSPRYDEATPRIPPSNSTRNPGGPYSPGSTHNGRRGMSLGDGMALRECHGRVIPPSIKQIDHIDPSIVSYNVWAAKDPETEELYHQLNVRSKPRKFFEAGKVFMTLWVEPMGDDAASSASRESFVGKYGELVYSTIRRFVIVKAGNGYCLALPIVVYRGLGVSMKGVKKSDHGIIYTAVKGRGKPEPTLAELPRRGEQGMLSQPIRVQMDDPRKKLAPMSRINYGRVYTLEHDLKVCGIGKVDKESMQDLLNQWQAVVNNSIQPDLMSKILLRAESRSAIDLLRSPGGEKLLAALSQVLPSAIEQDESMGHWLRAMLSGGLPTDSRHGCTCTPKRCSEDTPKRPVNHASSYEPVSTNAAFQTLAAVVDLLEPGSVDAIKKGNIRGN